MPKKVKLITVERENADGTPTKIEFTGPEWSFVNYYFSENMNAVQAYLRVFPKSSYDAARSSASNYLSKPNIKAEIKHRLDEKAMPSSEVLARLSDMARATHKPFIRVDDDGFVYFNFADDEAKSNLHLIKKIKTKRERRIDGSGEDAEEWEGEWVEVELHDAAAALRDLGRYHAMFTDKAVVGGEISIVKKTVGIDMDKI